MASHKAWDSRLSPHAMVMWRVNMMQPVNAIQPEPEHPCSLLRAKEPQRAASSY